MNQMVPAGGNLTAVQAEDPIVLSSKSNRLKGSNGVEGRINPQQERARVETCQTYQGGSQELKVRVSSSHGNDSSGSRHFHWHFKHTKDFSVTDDPDGITHMYSHCKSAGCPIPTGKNLIAHY